MQGEGEAEEGDEEVHTHNLYCECKRGDVGMPPTVLCLKLMNVYTLSRVDSQEKENSKKNGKTGRGANQEDDQLGGFILTERVNMFGLEILHVQICVYMQ